MKNDTKTLPIIKCPHCGWEYLPCEIYLPDYMLGRSDEVVRDPLGKIIYQDYQEGYEPDLTEHYICDNCNKPFVVEGQFTFKVKAEKAELDFSDTSASLLD